MTVLPCYVAAPYTMAPRVRLLHAELSGLGFTPLSTWAEEADGSPEALTETPRHVLRSYHASNMRGVSEALFVVALTHPTLGREMYVECGAALAMGTPVFWHGPGPGPLSRLAHPYSVDAPDLGALFDSLAHVATSGRLHGAPVAAAELAQLLVLARQIEGVW